MDKMREDFEKWILSETGFDTYRTNFGRTKPEDQQYMCHHTNIAWLAWKSSREHLCIGPLEKQDEKQRLFDFQRAYVQGYNSAVDFVVKSLDKVGVNYK